MLQATVLSHAKQHEAALKLLEPLMEYFQKEQSFSNDMHEEAFLATCFLLLDIYFLLRRLSNVAGRLFETILAFRDFLSEFLGASIVRLAHRELKA